jgi:predicted metal-dependent phosphoesterase TrpH
MACVTVDFHVHTRVSPDGLDAPERVVAAAREAGLSALAITDHDRSAGYRRLVDLGLADPAGRAVDGLLVIPGVEVSTSSGHVLVLGATFDTPPRRGGISVDALRRFVRLNHPGALLVAAHPLDRTRSGVGAAIAASGCFDAIEAFNSKTLDRGANRRAGELASGLGLPSIAGSDAHSVATVGRARTIVDAAELSTDAVLAGVRAGRTQVVAGLHTHREIAAYVARGWLTRPWVADWTRRAATSVAGDLRPRALLRRRNAQDALAA